MPSIKPRAAKDAINRTIGRSRHSSNHRRQKTPSLGIKPHQSINLAEVAICKPAQSAFFHLTYLNCDASVFVFSSSIFVLFFEDP